MKLTRDDIRRAMCLYAVTDRAWLGDRTLLQVTEDILRGGATCLQLREKELGRAEFLAEARAMQALASAYGVPFLVNDSVEIALASGAGGVHVGQSDLKDRDIRALIGPDKILGISANTVETALAAQAAGADYIGAGAVFGTSTKPDAKTLSQAELRAICEAVDIPVVAIGGITADNLLQLRGSGVDGAAVVSALYAQADPGRAAARLRALAGELVAAHG